MIVCPNKFDIPLGLLYLCTLYILWNINIHPYYWSGLWASLPSCRA